MNVERVVKVCWSAGFLAGTIMHILDITRLGVFGYYYVSDWINVYWTGLTVLDPLAAVLIWWQRRAGIVLGLAIMLSDIIINSYVSTLPGFGMGWQNALQFLFAGFVVGSAPLIARQGN